MSLVNVACYDHEGVIRAVFELIEESLVPTATPTGTTALTITKPVNIADHYISGGQILSRPNMLLSTGGKQLSLGDTFHVYGIPEMTKVIAPDGTKIIEGGELSWVAPVAGLYLFTFVKAPYIEQQLYLNVT